MKRGVLTLATALALAFHVPVAAQSTFATYDVADWSDLIPEQRVNFQTYRSIIITDGTLSADQKAARVAAKYTEIEQAIRNTRRAAYEAVTRTYGVGNSATKGSSGGEPKEVDRKCRGADMPDMYVTADRVRGAYKSGSDDAGPGVIATGNAVGAADIIIDNGAQICAIGLKQSGKGRKVSYSEGEFRIRPSRITQIVNAEITPIMAEITKSPL